MSKTVSEILSAAADLIEPEGAWTQGAFSRNADGTADYGGDDEELLVAESPICWCALGALAQVTGRDPLAVYTFSEVFEPSETARAKVFLRQVLDEPIETWNDAPDRTQAEVVAKLREAAEKAREQGL